MFHTKTIPLLSSGHKLDLRVAREIETSIKSGILINHHNEAADRLARNVARHASVIRKSNESHDLADERARLDEEIREAERKQIGYWIQTEKTRYADD